MFGPMRAMQWPITSSMTEESRESPQNTAKNVSLTLKETGANFFQRSEVQTSNA